LNFGKDDLIKQAYFDKIGVYFALISRLHLYHSFLLTSILEVLLIGEKKCIFRRLFKQNLLFNCKMVKLNYPSQKLHIILCYFLIILNDFYLG
jgi:hypothetical protein